MRLPNVNISSQELLMQRTLIKILKKLRITDAGDFGRDNGLPLVAVSLRHFFSLCCTDTTELS